MSSCKEWNQQVASGSHGKLGHSEVTQSSDDRPRKKIVDLQVVTISLYVHKSL